MFDDVSSSCPHHPPLMLLLLFSIITIVILILILGHLSDVDNIMIMITETRMLGMRSGGQRKRSS
jgi:hypothetical protein